MERFVTRKPLAMEGADLERYSGLRPQWFFPDFWPTNAERELKLPFCISQIACFDD